VIRGFPAGAVSAPHSLPLIAVVRKWKRRLEREIELAHAAHRRATAIVLRSEFECVGGPLDGKVLATSPFLAVYVDAGVYDHGPDHRLHFQPLRPDWWREPPSFLRP